MAVMDGMEQEQQQPQQHKFITTEELRKHKQAGDVWISIQGKVYEVTGRTRDHPGGDLPILGLAGQDVTDAFFAYHPGSAWKHRDRCFIGHLLDYHVSDVSKDYHSLLAQISKLGLFDNKGHSSFVSLSVIFLLFIFCFYGVVASTSTLVHCFSGGLMGFLWIQSGWIGHDSGHYSIMSNAKFNRLLQVLAGNCLTGVSIAWWKRSRNSQRPPHCLQQLGFRSGPSAHASFCCLFQVVYFLDLLLL